MNATFPFAELDVTKLMANFKLPGFEYDALVEAQKRNVASLQEAGTIMTKVWQEIAQRQVEMAQKGFETVVAGAGELAKAPSPEAGAKCHVAFCQQALETHIANLQELGEMARKAGGEALEVVNKRFVEGLDEVISTTAAAGNGAVKAAPKPKAAK
jgi:phasin family protein